MSHIPYGYIIEGGAAKVDERAAEEIRALFKEFIDCKSMSVAATRVGMKKAHSTIGRIISKRVYVGTSFYPQIVDEDTFNKANEIKIQNAIAQNRIKEIKQDEPMIMNAQFQLGTLENRYDDPYKQAEYVYSQIKEVNDEWECCSDPG